MEPLNADAGLAKMGFSCKLDIAIAFAANSGIMLSLNGFSNDVNEDMLTGGTSTASVERSISTTSWKAASALIGFFGQTVPATGKVSFFGKIQGGYAITRSPSINIVLKSGGTTSGLKQDMGTAKAWVLDAGGGINIPFGSTYMFNCGLDYIFMTSDFNDIFVVQSVQTGSKKTTNYNTGNFRMSLSNLLFQVGIAWRM